MYFSGFAIPPEDGLQAAAAGGLRAAPPEVLNARNYDKKAKLCIKKAQKHNEENTMLQNKYYIASSYSSNMC
jgi:hypothetical protein